ncbi:hypothetical protein [Phycicoccus sp. Root101]|uniref:hypothetical protein n=1 Tax=Phycicoccus sp. Root101 TaxID=1736421 RepID=UPI0012FB4CEA|nr:hypothetical protein [Phycicoccus sp. Root101]
MVRDYDPDHVVSFRTSIVQEEQLAPGWLQSRLQPGTDPALIPELLESSGDDPVEFGEDLCEDYARVASPYFLEHDQMVRPRLTSLSTSHLSGLTPSDNFDEPSTAAYASAPAAVRGDLGLLLGMRLGFAEEPQLPFDEEALLAGPDQARTDLIRLAVGGSVAARPAIVCWYGKGPAVSVLPENLPDVWSRSAVGTVPVGPGRAAHHRYVVVGDTAEDFALAFGLDRMMGGAAWVPSSLTGSEPDLQAVQAGIHDLRYEGRWDAGRVIFTSASLEFEDVAGICRKIQGDASFVLAPMGDEHGGPSDPPVFQAAANLDLSDASHVACADHDYDIGTALPGASGVDDSFSCAAPIPVHVPRHAALTAQRPFWEVDVHVNASMPPSTRSVPSSTWVAKDRESWGHPWIRSSKVGLSFHAHSMGLVMSTQSLEQAVARPRLVIPGLGAWCKARVSWLHPDWNVDFSDAGRRAQVMARLLGNRDRLLEVLPEVLPLLREFIPMSASSSVSYPSGDGVCLGAGHGVLSFAASRRALGNLSDEEVRRRLDELLDGKLIRRGLVLSCHDCGTKSFYQVDVLQQLNRCPRCAGENSLTSERWRRPVSEPVWFYDLHGALRELLAQDGDVPILAAAHLRKQLRDFRDVAELDISTASGDRLEIDLVAQSDREFVVGEAKKRASLGTGSSRSKAIQKLTTVAELFAATQVVMATTDPAPWAPNDVRLLRSRLDVWQLPLPPPRIRVVTGLGTAALVDAFA